MRAVAPFLFYDKDTAPLAGGVEGCNRQHPRDAPQATMSLPTFKKGACYPNPLLPVTYAVHAVAQCEFSTLHMSELH